MQQPEGEPGDRTGHSRRPPGGPDHDATKRPMSSWAGTGAQCAVAGSVYTPPTSHARGVEQEVRHRVRRVRHRAHGVAWSGNNRIRYGVTSRVERVDDRTDDLAVPSFERVDLDVGATLVPRLVGRFDVQHEQIAIVERIEARARLRAVVVVEAGRSRRERRRLRCRSSTPRPCTRSTADDMRAVDAVRRVEGRQRRA